MIQKLRIKSKQGDYEVEFCDALDFSHFSLNRKESEYFVLADNSVWNLFSHKLIALDGFPIYLIDSNEESKTLEGVNNFAKWLINNRANKSSTILAIGGGIVQDLATFTAHIFKRGIKWEYFPTTLLSQSDSCIGAKCGINLMPYKNQLGVMHSPKKVWIASEFLETLDDETLMSGFGEILKLSLTPPYRFYSELKTELFKNGINRERTPVWVSKSLRAKQAIIESDEYENDLRRILNYGHSFGHALEAVSENKVSHGYGVLFGIDLINYLANRWGILEKEIYLDIRTTIQSNFSTNFLPAGLTATMLIDALKTDKKISSGFMNFAIMNNSWELVIEPKVINNELQNLVENYLKNECIFTSN